MYVAHVCLCTGVHTCKDQSMILDIAFHFITGSLTELKISVLPELISHKAWNLPVCTSQD